MSKDPLLTSSPSVARHPLRLTLRPQFEPILRTLRTHPRPFILGASGGIDSSAAMLLLAHAQCPVLVIHVHHHLREDADNDAQIVQKQAALLGLPMRVVHLPAPSDTETENLSARSRRLRYDALTEFADTFHADVVTAHHADDVFETLTMRILRGAHLQHVFGPKHTLLWNGRRVLRPLLSVWKKDLRDLVIAADFPWIEDSSNASDTYLRNRLRRRMGPLIDTLSQQPKGAQTLAHLVKESQTLSASDTEIPPLAAQLGRAPSDLLARTRSPAHSLWIARIDAMRVYDYDAKVFRNALYQWCIAQRITPRRDVLTQIAQALWEGTSMQRDLRGMQLQVHAQGLLLRPAPTTASALEVPSLPTHVPLHPNAWTDVGSFRLRIQENAGNFEVWARPWQHGDQMISPHSGRMVGVRKRLARDGVPQAQRDQAVVVLARFTTKHSDLVFRSQAPMNDAVDHGTMKSMLDASLSTVLGPQTDACTGELTIVGALYAHNQRLEIRVTPTMRVVIESAPCASDVLGER